MTPSHAADAASPSVIALRLDQVDPNYLLRDRITLDVEEISFLKDSIRLRGQQTPIEVADLGDGRFGLITGWRRHQALSDLMTETQDARFATIQAILRTPASMADAYVTMIIENEIRVGLSYYERAHVVAKTVEAGIFPDRDTALRTLFEFGSRAKRSKIRSFLVIVDALDDSLSFPEAIPERLGLVISRGLEKDPDLGPRIKARLASERPHGSDVEHEIILSEIARGQDAEPKEVSAAAPDPAGEADEDQDADEVEITPRMRLRTDRSGSFTLTGEGMTPDFRAALVEFLRSYEARTS